VERLAYLGGELVMSIFIKNGWPLNCWVERTTKFCNNAKIEIHIDLKQCDQIRQKFALWLLLIEHFNILS